MLYKRYRKKSIGGRNRLYRKKTIGGSLLGNLWDVVKTGSKMVLDKGKDLLKWGSQKALTAGIDKANELTQQAIDKGVDAAKKALTKGADLLAAKVARAPLVKPVGQPLKEKIKTLTSNPQVRKVLQERANQLINVKSRAILSNILSGSGVKQLK